MRVDHYELSGELGRGGMGVVYRGRDTLLGRDVALKLFGPETALDAELAARFQREAQAASSLRHPNLVGVLGAGVWQGRPYLVLELVVGETLRALLRREGRLSPEVAARIGSNVARGLEHAHQAGVLHRDVKAENVLLDATGAARLTDFGLAGMARAGGRLTASGEVLGTPAAMAPEQVLGDRDRLGPWTDVWGLGVLLYEALVGESPFLGTSAAAVLEQTVLSRVAPPRTKRPDLDPALDALVLACLQKAPEARPASARAVADALDEVRARLEKAARRRSGPTQALPPPRPPWALGALAGLLAVVVAVEAGLLVQAREQARREAEQREADGRRLAELQRAHDERAAEAQRLRVEAAARQAEVARLTARVEALEGAAPRPAEAAGAEAERPEVARAIDAAEVDIRAGRLADARQRLERVLDAAPRAARGWNDLGYVLLNLGDRAGAAAALDRALALDPGHQVARTNRVEVRLQAGDLAGARDDLDALLAAQPGDVGLLGKRATVRDRLGDARGALDDADRLVLKARTAESLRVRGILRARIGDHRRALEDYEAALQLAPGDGETLVNRGVSRCELGDLPGAAADLEAALATGLTQAASAWGNLGTVYQMMKDDRRAVPAYDRALALDAAQPALRVNRAASRLRLGDAQGAIADCEEALKALPPDVRKADEARRTLAAAKAR